MNYPIYLGCTRWKHEKIGINAVVNARAGQQILNDDTHEDTRLMRDALAIHAKLSHRIRWYGPQSAFFRRHRTRIEHLIDRYDN